MTRQTVACALVLVVALAPRPSRAQQPTTQDPAATQGDSDEGAKTKTPKEKAPKEKKPKEKKPKKGLVRWLWVPHPELRVGKQVRVDFRVRIQEASTKSDAVAGDQAELDIAHRRIGMEGELLDKKIAFDISREMASVEAKSIDPWRDAWIGYQQFTFARAQYRIFKLPFSIDENTGATNLDFAYRSLAATTLAPGRDHGGMFHGQVLNHAVGYEYGVFDHDGHNAHVGINSSRVTGGETKVWRLTTQPLRRVKSKWTDLEVGYAQADTTLPEGESSVKGRTVAGFEFYKPKYLVAGARKRTGFEMRFRPGPFSLKAEYITLTEERLGEGVEDQNLSPLTAKGWYVSGTWAITGESKSAGLDEVNRPLFQGGFGAVEIGMRVEKIAFSSEATDASPNELGSRSVRSDIVFKNSDSVQTYGVTWFPNRWVKVQLNVIKEELANPGEGPLPLQPSFWSQVVRVQFGF